MVSWRRFVTAVATDPKRSLLAFDFDGTLSPIVDDPETAVIDPELEPFIAELALKVRVAVISGRPSAFLEQAIQIDQVEKVGNYGRSERVSNEVKAKLHRIEDALEGDLSSRVYVEAKPTSVAFHFRRSPEVAQPLLIWAAKQAKRHGLEVVAGKAVIELCAPSTSDKGVAMAGLARGATAIAYFADDLGDLPALLRLPELARITFAVAISSPELDPALLRYADEVWNRNELRNSLSALLATLS